MSPSAPALRFRSAHALRRLRAHRRVWPASLCTLSAPVNTRTLGPTVFYAPVKHTNPMIPRNLKTGAGGKSAGGKEEQGGG